MSVPRKVLDNVVAVWDDPKQRAQVEQGLAVLALSFGMSADDLLAEIKAAYARKHREELNERLRAEIRERLESELLALARKYGTTFKLEIRATGDPARPWTLDVSIAGTRARMRRSGGSGTGTPVKVGDKEYKSIAEAYRDLAGEEPPPKTHAGKALRTWLKENYYDKDSGKWSFPHKIVWAPKGSQQWETFYHPQVGVVAKIA